MLRTASGLPSGGLVQALMKTSSAAQMISEKVNRPPSGPTAQKPQGSSSPLFLSPSPQHRFGRCRPRPPQREPEVPPPPAQCVQSTEDQAAKHHQHHLRVWGNSLEGPGSGTFLSLHCPGPFSSSSPVPTLSSQGHWPAHSTLAFQMQMVRQHREEWFQQVPGPITETSEPRFPHLTNGVHAEFQVDMQRG